MLQSTIPCCRQHAPVYHTLLKTACSSLPYLAVDSMLQSTIPCCRQHAPVYHTLL
ncbi:hypothetical protein BgiMline_005503, partial [Biomphalaria glabrata]